MATAGVTNPAPGMQHWPLLIPKILDHAAAIYPRRAIVGADGEGGLDRSDWATLNRRARQVARAFEALGVKRGDRVATLAWNSIRHLECWYGANGLGAVLHTINPRLFSEQIQFIANHAGDAVLLFDAGFAPLVESLRPQLTSVRHFVVLADRAHMPAGEGLLCFEELVEAASADFEWAMLDENEPSGLCYTSGTTGDPKGVLYSHRSNVLHAMATCTANGFNISARSTILPVVPMYHANAWGVAFSAAMAGARLVLNGPHFDAPTLHRLIVDHEVTLTLAVPTVWLAMLDYLDREKLSLGKLETVIIGGSAVPKSMIEHFRDRFGVTVVQAWGMTEMSPLGSAAVLDRDQEQLPSAERTAIQAKQGRPPFGVEMEIVDDAGQSVARDGTAFGHLRVRGPWTVDHYYAAPASALDSDGWFDTGDVATIDPGGVMQSVDRSKDVIKSGGEWISSAELENAAVGCAGVAEAAVIGIADDKWGERPLLLIVERAGEMVDLDQVRAHLAACVARWWIPEQIRIVPDIPHTATGKISKLELRRLYAADGS